MGILNYILGVLVFFSPLYAMPWWMQSNQNGKNRHFHGKQFKGQGHFNGQRNSRGNMMSSSSRNSSLFATHETCIRCHNNLRDSKGNDVSIIRDWKGSMMANSALDPLWQAKVSSEIIRNPSLKSVIEKKCSTCHMPMAKTQAEADNEKIEIFETGFLNKKNKYHKLAKDGVSCTLCHQIKQDNLGQESSFSGGYLIDKITKKPYRKIYGPYQNPFDRPMIRSSGFQPVYSKHIKKSELCATCHTLKTPTVFQGNIVGEFPEQTPYLEWKHSNYSKTGQTCQKCHMPQAEGSVKISRMPRFLKARQPFSKHYFVGGNVFILSILRDNASSLGVKASRAELNRTIQRTLDLLKNNTAEVNIGTVSIKNGILEFPVIVENKAGHKFPSGIPIRRAWLHVVVKDKNGRIVFESGAVKKNGMIIGADSDIDPYRFEPHYDVITSPDQVQIYETVMKDYAGNITYTFLEAYEYQKDNRLLPEGFNKETASEDIKPKGEAEEDENFIGGSDTVLYRINTKGFKGPFTITVELRYQSVSYSFFKDLIKDADKSQYIKRFQNLYNKKSNTGIVIDKKEVLF
jgi:hypothetical protein